jgi:hypothetical protein
MPTTEYRWLPSPHLTEEQAVAEGWKPVAATEMPELAEDGDDTVRLDAMGLYKRDVNDDAAGK